MKEDSEAWNKRWDSRLRYYECKDPFTSWICRIGAVVINDETMLEAGRKMGSEGKKGLASGAQVLHWDVGHRPIRVHVRYLRIEDEAEDIGYIL
jgi:hypothetical protein